MKATKVNAGLAESSGRLLLGIWRDSLHVTCGLTACTLGSAPGPTLGNEYGKTLPLVCTWISWTLSFRQWILYACTGFQYLGRCNLYTKWISLIFTFYADSADADMAFGRREGAWILLQWQQPVVNFVPASTVAVVASADAMQAAGCSTALVHFSVLCYLFVAFFLK